MVRTARRGCAQVDREFIALSIERERKAQGRARRVRALVYVLLIGVIVVLGGFIEKAIIEEMALRDRYAAV